MSDGATLMNELRDLTERLDGAGKEVYRLQTELHELQVEARETTEEYDDRLTDLLVSLIDKYEEEGKRPPGEEARNAIVKKQLRDAQPDLFGHKRRLDRELAKKEDELKRKTLLAGNIQSQIMSKQSSLSYLKTEMQAVGA
jgi:hypothetical protein